MNKNSCLPLLAHDWHVEVVDEGKFETLAALVVVRVVEGLNVKEHCVTVVLSRLRTLGSDTGEDEDDIGRLDGDDTDGVAAEEGAGGAVIDSNAL